MERRVPTEHGVSSSSVHITETTMKAGSTSIETGSDRWSARGYDVRTLISLVYDIDVRRIDFANSHEHSADPRYDLTVQLPREVDEETMRRMLADALEGKFGLQIAPQTRAMDVYVLTAPSGPGAGLHRHGGQQGAGDAGLEDGGQITYFGKDCSGVSSGGIAASAGSMGEFRRTLEPELDRLLLDETHLAGSYDFKIGNYTNQEELFKLMHDELGIVVTAAQRQVQVLTVRPPGAGQEMQAAL